MVGKQKKRGRQSLTLHYPTLFLSFYRTLSFFNSIAFFFFLRLGLLSSFVSFFASFLSFFLLLSVYISLSTSPSLSLPFSLHLLPLPHTSPSRGVLSGSARAASVTMELNEKKHTPIHHGRGSTLFPHIIISSNNSTSKLHTPNWNI